MGEMKLTMNSPGSILRSLGIRSRQRSHQRIRAGEVGAEDAGVEASWAEVFGKGVGDRGSQAHGYGHADELPSGDVVYLRYLVVRPLVSRDHSSFRLLHQSASIS